MYLMWARLFRGARAPVPFNRMRHWRRIANKLWSRNLCRFHVFLVSSRRWKYKLWGNWKRSNFRKRYYPISVSRCNKMAQIHTDNTTMRDLYRISVSPWWISEPDMVVLAFISCRKVVLFTASSIGYCDIRVLFVSW